MPNDNQQIIEKWAKYCNRYWAGNKPKYFSKGKAKDSKVVLEVPLNFGEDFILKALSSQDSEFLKKHDAHTEHHIKLREKALRSQKSELKAQWRKEVESRLHKDKDCWVGEEPGCGVNQRLSELLKKL